ncbi:large subunit ribosomal protein L6 [Peptoniphilus asaccharolyticus DSM 20463]|uniref:Large ribosomal subunit protein uL6 n=1 Tax=Peptoniphilus asaccharolyticus DSM 20463 TaxID=573058 RepID=A0A1W1VKZ2_PEPAS|nr:50S ribosomal protein L6 [Peptoniphilus asaccharolyticus]MBL7574493.1 50S ribosomal protein L6 [Peptoniphilus asaccharolyticus]SMB94055.1 large subunit ribosomal protein L6 [Peptoniphilus asaccharolyticus DSM 20463]
MSRIGKKPIEIPSGVDVKFDGNTVTVKGPKGELSQTFDSSMKISLQDGSLIVERPSDSKKHKSLHGLVRTLIQNMVVGVTEGYKKELEIIGTGYRAAKNGKKLALNLGFSHPLELEDPAGIETEVPAPTKIIVSGIDKQQVGQYAALIRKYRQPEPYKGKGIRYVDEYVRRKVGKTGK